MNLHGFMLKNNNWKLKSAFFPKWNENNNEKLKLRLWCLTVSHWNIFQWKGYLTFTQKGNLEYSLNLIFSHFHNSLSWINEKNKSYDSMLIWTSLKWLGIGSTNEFRSRSTIVLFGKHLKDRFLSIHKFMNC